MQRLRLWVVFFFLVLPTMAGCVGEGEVPSAEREEAPSPSRPVVVALLDTGINPYHNVFRAAPGMGAERYAGAFGAEVAELTPTGGMATRLLDDEAIWAALEPGKLYAFAGTRVLAISFSGPAPVILDAEGHGTGTASLVAREAPDALVLMLQSDTDYCVPDGECVLFPEKASAMAWAADQPWIDIVSVSLGVPGNPPIPSAAKPDTLDYVAATRLASERGKLVVNSAGNTVAPSLSSFFAGPAWVICIGGADPNLRGETVEASKGVDVVANYTETMADHESEDRLVESSGTSFATPIVAGTLANALHLVRMQGEDARATPAALRAALNATAMAFGATEWDVREGTAHPGFGQTAPVLLPPAQQGWGYVDGSMAQEIARRVLEDDLAPPPEKAVTATYMAQWQSLRDRYWQNAP